MREVELPGPKRHDFLRRTSVTARTPRASDFGHHELYEAKALGDLGNWELILVAF